MYPMSMDTDSREASSDTGKATEFSKRTFCPNVSVSLSLGCLDHLSTKEHC